MVIETRDDTQYADLYWADLNEMVQDELSELIGGNGHFDAIPLASINLQNQDYRGSYFFEQVVDSAPRGTQIQLDYLHNNTNGNCDVSGQKITGNVIGVIQDPDGGVLYVDWDNGARFVLDLKQDKWHVID